MSIGLPKGKPKNLRRAACSKCGNVWSIATTQDTQKGYYCPDCTRERVRKNESRRNQSGGRERIVCREEN
mgnify:CR=1 FL=1